MTDVSHSDEPYTESLFNVTFVGSRGHIVVLEQIYYNPRNKFVVMSYKPIGSAVSRRTTFDGTVQQAKLSFAALVDARY